MPRNRKRNKQEAAWQRLVDQLPPGVTFLELNEPQHNTQKRKDKRKFTYNAVPAEVFDRVIEECWGSSRYYCVGDSRK